MRTFKTFIVFGTLFVPTECVTVPNYFLRGQPCTKTISCVYPALEVRMCAPPSHLSSCWIPSHLCYSVSLRVINCLKLNHDKNILFKSSVSIFSTFFVGFCFVCYLVFYFLLFYSYSKCSLLESISDSLIHSFILLYNNVANEIWI